MKSTAPKNPISKQIATLYRQELWALSNLLETHDISFSQLPFIMALYVESGITQDALAAQVQVDKASATRVLKQLEVKGMVTRERCPNDARARLVFVTEKARAIEVVLIQIIKEWNDILLEGVSEGELETLKSVQAKMIHNAEKYRNNE
ncbi:MarR family winged helix-turn-helix transcriptional regulator [Vibrio splendidus]